MLCGEGNGNTSEPLQQYARLHIEVWDSLNSSENICNTCQEGK
jgi:hypothetical protein